LNSEAKIILASGLFDPSKRLEAAVIGAKYFVQKPYNLNEVIKLIRQMLDEGK
jgi:DNA-binding response OmpR family regulator